MDLSLVMKSGDPVLMFTFSLLALCSVLTWGIILFRGWSFMSTRSAVKRDMLRFFNSTSLDEAKSTLGRSKSPVANMIAAGIQGISEYHDSKKTLGENCSLDEFLTRVLRNALNIEFSAMDAGLTVLASIGSTAPFIGLFGTVWGIMHALTNIAAKGEASIDVVAGPMGEALVATAIGLAAAIPAVLAFNAFVRGNRVLQNTLDHFAHDLHSTLIGTPLSGKR